MFQDLEKGQQEHEAMITSYDGNKKVALILF